MTVDAVRTGSGPIDPTPIDPTSIDPTPIDYDGRRFRPAGPGGAGRVAHYRQEGDLLRGEFSGGHARHGTLAGTCAPDGTLDFAYCMVLDDGSVISGHCRSTPTVLSDDRIRLHEVWERYGPHAERGESALEEIR